MRTDFAIIFDIFGRNNTIIQLETPFIKYRPFHSRVHIRFVLHFPTVYPSFDKNLQFSSWYYISCVGVQEYHAKKLQFTALNYWLIF